jgi:hypothetical protein
MLRRTIFALGLCSSGLASPVYSRDNYPALSTSKGFNLIVNLTNPSDDFDPPIHKSFVTTIHVGAGLSLVGISAEKGPVFFQNGTDEERTAGQSTVVTLGGTPPTAAGFKLTPGDQPAGFASGDLDFGLGTPGIAIHGEPVAYLTPETFYACNEPLEYYQGKDFVVIKQRAAGSDVPPECRAVRLIPKCAELAPLPGNAYANYDFAFESSCYDDVAAIDWSQYSQG